MFVLRHADGTKRAAQSGAAQMPRRAALSRVERPEISSAFLQRHARRDGASARGEGGTGGAAGAVANDADAAREVRVLEDATFVLELSSAFERLHPALTATGKLVAESVAKTVTAHAKARVSMTARAAALAELERECVKSGAEGGGGDGVDALLRELVERATQVSFLFVPLHFTRILLTV